MKLKELRKQWKITQQKLSGILGVSRSTIAMWETGDNEPDHAMLVRIAEFFQVSVDDLLEHTVSSTANQKEIQPTEPVSELDSRLFAIIRSMPAHEKEALLPFLEARSTFHTDSQDPKAAQEETPFQR